MSLTYFLFGVFDKTMGNSSTRKKTEKDLVAPMDSFWFRFRGERGGRFPSLLSLSLFFSSLSLCASLDLLFRDFEYVKKKEDKSAGQFGRGRLGTEGVSRFEEETKISFCPAISVPPALRPGALVGFYR